MANRCVVVAVSDLHFGSTVGLCPPEGIQVQDGGVMKASRMQVGLWKFWSHFWEKHVPGYWRESDAARVLVLNGDLIDGNHHQTVNIVTPSITHQKRAAILALKGICKRFDQVYVIRGTEAHVGSGAQADEEIGEQLGGQKDTNGDFSHWQLWREIGGVVFQFAHHIGVTSSTAYESSAPMREMVAGFVEAGQWGRRIPNVVVRSHRHRYVRVCIPSRYGEVESIITPAWQLRTPFVERIDRMRMPHIGGVVFEVEDGVCKTNSKIYEIPEGRTVQVPVFQRT